jgi:Ribose/Galactose Isomerase
MTSAACGLALQQAPPVMLQAAIASLRRDGLRFVELPGCNGEPCAWVRGVADCLKRGQCRGAVIFCGGTGVAACVSNKVPGIRAVSVNTVMEAEQAMDSLAANVLIVDPVGRTFFEFKAILRLASGASVCPAGVACVLEELDGHAHR